MGQKMAKKEPGRGARLFEEQRFEEAIEEWKTTLTKKQNISEQFTLYGQICRAYLDVGNPAEALEFAGKQMAVANSNKDNLMKSESFFHLAICYEMISDFSKSILYCRNSLQLVDTDNPCEGYLYLCLGNSFVGLGEFPKAWNNYKKTLTIVDDSGDKLLEILAYTKLGVMFNMLKDFDAAIDYCSKAWGLVNNLKDTDPNIKYRRWVGVCLAAPYRNTGRYQDATDLTEDAMKIAMLYNDVVVQVKCMILFAEIHRTRGDNERALPRYESALSLLKQIGDKVGEVDVLLGIVKTYKNTNNTEKAIELATGALEIAKKIGNKLQMLRCHAMLKFLYFDTRETTLSGRHHANVKQLGEEMDIYCYVCSQLMGKEAETLSVLSCGHIIHGRCVKATLLSLCVLCERTQNNVYDTTIDG